MHLMDGADISAAIEMQSKHNLNASRTLSEHNLFEQFATLLRQSAPMVSSAADLCMNLAEVVCKEQLTVITRKVILNFEQLNMVRIIRN